MGPNVTMPKLYCLFEHSTGYALLKMEEIEEIAALLPIVQESMGDYAKFAGHVKLAAFSPFTSAVAALENMNAVTEGTVHADLKGFLENNLPAKHKKVILGVQDKKMIENMHAEFPDLQLSTGEAIIEVCRTTRQYFPKMQKSLTPLVQDTAQRGLAHSYSRAKLRFNVHRQDNMIIQAIALIDQLDKNINTFSMRVREWYGYHFPELVRIVNENYHYCKMIKIIGRRENVLAAMAEAEDADEDSEAPELIANMEEILMDSTKVQSIQDAARKSVGMDISDIDLMNVEYFANQVIELADYRKELQEYLRSKMSAVAPNLAALIGDVVGARLISHAGSLTNLAKYPASTVQILGAEKALFRALKKRGNTPKYGLLFHSTFIGRATAKNKGRISRFLANKCSIASRIDAFSETPNNIFGDKLKEQVEERLKLYEDGTVPRKNLDVMKEAIQAVGAIEAPKRKAEDEGEADGEPKKKKKKSKKSKAVEEESTETVEETATAESVEVASPEKKKKKKKKAAEAEPEEEAAAPVEEAVTEESPKKKKKKKKKAKEEPSEEAEPTTEEASQEVDSSEKKKKKKKKKVEEE